MDVATHIAHVREASAALLGAYRADPAAPVATCPGWDRATLLRHVSLVQSWARTQITRGPDERVGFKGAEQPPEHGIDAWFEAGVEDLAAKLDQMDVTRTWPTWAGPQPGTFFPRRMAQEAAMHRWDAVPYAIDAALAVDGVDEHLELFAPLISGEQLGSAERTIHLHATDVEGDAGEWLVHVGPAGITFEHGHAKGDVALRGTAGDLLLWIWNRLALDDRFEVFGDGAVLDDWTATVRI